MLVAPAPARQPGQGEPHAAKLVGALGSGLAILRHLNRTGGRQGVNRIARDLRLNPSTCFNLLRTLVHEGLVDFDPLQKTYSPALGLVELARGALEHASFARFMRPHLEAITARHAVTSTLWQRSGADRVVLVDHCEAESAMRLHMQLGQRLPIYVAALGRCMAARSRLGKSALRDAFRALRWESPPSFEAYWKSVVTARDRGWATDEGNFVQGVTTVSAVVCDADGLPVMALSAAGFGARLNRDRVEALGADLRERAAAVERALSGRAPQTQKGAEPVRAAPGG